MGAIEELLGVGTRISPRINEDFALIKFTLNELHSVEIIVDRSWDFEFTLNWWGIPAMNVHIKEVQLYNFAQNIFIKH